jgi:hypothetical protein
MTRGTEAFATFLFVTGAAGSLAKDRVLTPEGTASLNPATGVVPSVGIKLGKLVNKGIPCRSDREVVSGRGPSS